MKVSAISLSEDSISRKNIFIKYANSFMSSPEVDNPIEKANEVNNKKLTKMGIETLESFTIFPKEVVDGKTIITA